MKKDIKRRYYCTIDQDWRITIPSGIRDFFYKNTILSLDKKRNLARLYFQSSLCPEGLLYARIKRNRFLIPEELRGSYSFYHYDKDKKEKEREITLVKRGRRKKKSKLRWDYFEIWPGHC